MLKLEKWILENKYRKLGMEAAIGLSIFNIAIVLAIQEAKLSVPGLLKINILLILAGIFFLEVRPRR